MREAAGLLVVVLLLLASLPAEARPAVVPLEVSAELSRDPVVGETFQLTVVVHANTDWDEPMDLQVPAWVEVGPDPRWDIELEAGQNASHSWYVQATDPGPWGARLDSPTYRFPTLYAISLGATAGWSGQEPGWALPGNASDEELRGETEAGIELGPADDETVRVGYQVEPPRAWMRSVGELTASISHGGDERTHRANGTVDWSPAVPLSEGETKVYTTSTSWRVAFPTGNGTLATAGAMLDCANREISRQGDQVREIDRWTCLARPGSETNASQVEPGASDPHGGERTIPDPSSRLAVAILCLVAAGRRCLTAGSYRAGSGR